MSAPDRTVGGMTRTQTMRPGLRNDPGDDPDAILAALPEPYRSDFAEAYYAQARAAAGDAKRYSELAALVRLWRMRTMAILEPGYAERHAAVQRNIRKGRFNGATAEEAFGPGWQAR